MFSGSVIVLFIAMAKLLFHLLTANRYGIFRDELYYLACAEHLDWGYVDHPPLIALTTWLSTTAFGSSLLGLRLLPALAGAGLVWLTGNIAKEIGGGRIVQALAALAVALAPIYLLMHHWMTMNAFEPLIWAGCIWCIVRAINVTILVIGVALAPLTAPILSVESYLRYQKLLGIDPIRAENQPTGPLPQYFADEFGWEDMTREVARIYNGLPASQRASTAIFANGYGQAGAIDFFGPKYGLPKAISNHQNYWLWGPRGYTGESVIVLGSDGTGDREHFYSVEVVGRAEHPYSRLDEHFDIFLCRGLKSDLRSFWPQTKNWN